MTGWPQAVVRCGPIARARMSEVPPAAKGTTKRIGLFGYWACAGAARRLAAKAATRAEQGRFMDVLDNKSSRTASVRAVSDPTPAPRIPDDGWPSADPYIGMSFNRSSVALPGYPDPGRSPWPI